MQCPAAAPSAAKLAQLSMAGAPPGWGSPRPGAPQGRLGTCPAGRGEWCGTANPQRSDPRRALGCLWGLFWAALPPQLTGRDSVGRLRGKRPASELGRQPFAVGSFPPPCSPPRHPAKGFRKDAVWKPCLECWATSLGTDQPSASRAPWDSFPLTLQWPWARLQRDRLGWKRLAPPVLTHPSPTAGHPPVTGALKPDLETAPNAVGVWYKAKRMVLFL